MLLAHTLCIIATCVPAPQSKCDAAWHNMYAMASFDWSGTHRVSFSHEYVPSYGHSCMHKLMYAPTCLDLEVIGAVAVGCMQA